MTLRWKLVALYALVLAAVVAAFGTLLVVRLRASLVNAAEAELEARVRTIGAVAELEKGKWIVESKTGVDDDYVLGRGLWYEVSVNGEVVLASPLARVLWPKGDAAPRTPPPGTAAIVSRTIVKGETEDEPAIRGAQLEVTCGKLLTDADRTVGALVGELMVVGPLVLLLSLAGGFWLAGRALHPIGAMAATAAEIGEHDLSRRMPVRGGDELARLATTLNAAFARLEAAFERQRRFVGDASHELRTPLAVVAGNLELALAKPRAPEEQKVLLGDAREAATSMKELIDGLLTLARADRGAEPRRREPVELKALCEDVARRCRPLAEEHRISIAVEGAQELVVPGERAGLEQLATNLVTNAVRYNEDGGAVTIRLAREPGVARLEVEDTGIGIPAGDLPRVFDRFYRVDEARSRDAGGAGLGLAIAKCIAEAHGGTISASSEPGRGSTFSVTLPA